MIKLNVVWKNWLKQKVRANMQKLCSNCHWKKQSLTDQIFSVVKFAIWNWILTKNLKPMKHVTMFAKYQIKLKQEIHILKSLCTHFPFPNSKFHSPVILILQLQYFFFTYQFHVPRLTLSHNKMFKIFITK